MDPKEGIDCIGYAAHDDKGVLVPFKFKRRFPGAEDVVFRVTHCGLAFEEIIWTFNLYKDTMYPIVPGHETVGVVTEVGSKVTKYKKGDRVGSTFFVNSCLECDSCNAHEEFYCEKGPIRAFNAIDRDNTVTRGGFSNLMVLNQRFIVKIPDSLRSDLAAPLLCAGVSVYNPMMQHGMNQPGKTLGVVGLGGLGHLAVKFGKEFGLRVTVLSTSLSKKEEALTTLGADEFLVSKDEAAMKAAVGTLDFIINTASAELPLNSYLILLKKKGVFVFVGVSAEMKFSPHLLFTNVADIPSGSRVLMQYRYSGVTGKSITGDSAGGMKEIQETLDFCGERNVVPMIETIPMDKLNEAMERLKANDVRYRFVIDIEKSLKE